MSLQDLKALLEDVMSESPKDLNAPPTHVHKAMKSIDPNAKPYRAKFKDGKPDTQRIVYHLDKNTHPDKVSEALKKEGFKGDSAMAKDHESMRSTGAHHHDAKNRLKAFVVKEHGSPTEVHIHTY